MASASSGGVWPVTEYLRWVTIMSRVEVRQRGCGVKTGRARGIGRVVWCYVESVEWQAPAKTFLLRRCAGRLHDDLLQALDARNGRGLRGALGSAADAAEWTEKRIREWGDTTFLSITPPGKMKLENNH